MNESAKPLALIDALWRRFRGTSSRTFFVYPAVTLLFQLILVRRWPRPLGLLLMLWGYLQYRLCGRYLMTTGEGFGYGQFSWNLRRESRAGSRAPARLVTGGPYSYTRNPMYMGHIICMAGLVLAFRSPVAVALALYHTWWLHQRALEDEALLAGRFGEEYAEYQRRVPRWLPGLPGRPVIPERELQTVNRTVTYSDLVRLARSLSGQELHTIGGNATFTVEVHQGRDDEVVYCIPTSSGKARRLGKGTEEALALFSQTGSMRPADYTSLTQNSVYILALIRELG
jgi:protein-S-isoprenylcysteine O-methyltransferase Ste14